VRRTIIVALTAALSCGVLPAVSQAHEATYPSTVTIHRANGQFYGNVGSANSACRQGRKVKVVKLTKTGAVAALVGSAITARKGNWHLKKAAKPGRYQARVTKALRGGYGHSHHCKPARSSVLVVKPR
jgi:hypothetical protein